MKSIAPAGAIAQARHRAARCWGHSHHHHCQRLRSDGYQGPRGSWEAQEQSSHTPCAPKRQEELREMLWESWRKSIQCLLPPPSPATHQKWPTKKKHHEFPNCPEKGQKCWVIKQRNHERGPRAAAHPSRHTPSVAEPLPLRGHPPQHHHHPRWVLQSRSTGKDSSRSPDGPSPFFSGKIYTFRMSSSEPKHRGRALQRFHFNVCLRAESEWENEIL